MPTLGQTDQCHVCGCPIVWVGKMWIHTAQNAAPHTPGPKEEPKKEAT